jgi:outer membrane protein
MKFKTDRINKAEVSLILSSLSFIIMVLVLYKTYTRPQVAYVRSQDLIYKYNGMQEAQQKYNAKTRQWEIRIDTLKNEYEQLVNEYRAKSDQWSEKQRQQREEQLKRKRQQLKKYQESVEQKAKKEDREITQGVLNQVNSFAKKYAREHGYDVILATTKTGNVLYGDDKLDITEHMLSELNKEYKGVE